MTVPNNLADTATFGPSTSTSVFISANTQIDGIVFTANASAYTISSATPLVLTISGVGVTNNSGVMQNVVTGANASQWGDVRFLNTATAGSQVTYTNGGGSGNTATTGGSGGTTEFVQTTTAGTATFLNSGGLAFLAPGGRTLFWNNSSAGAATFINGGGAASGAFGGLTQFRGSSTAASAVFTNNKGADSNTGGGTVEFRDDSTAGAGTFTNNGQTVSGAIPPTTSFFESSSAANSTITNLPGTDSSSSGGATSFRNSSTAGNALIRNRAATAPFAPGGGTTTFSDTATAGNSTVLNNGGTANGRLGGATAFTINATAGNAIIVAEGGSNGGNGGSINLSGQANAGGLAQFKVFGNGKLDITQGPIPGTAIGSLEGTGNVFLGGRTLTTGSNNRSTTFTGLIQDASNSNGSLTKVGTGTLTLGGANTYKGTTTINAGRLLVTNTTGSGTGTSGVLVNNGSALGGTGTITGNLSEGVTVNSGGILSAGDAGTASGSLKVAKLTLSPDSIIEFGVGPSGAHSVLSRTGGTWSFVSNQMFSLVNAGSAPGVYDNIITGLAADPGTTASWMITTPGFSGSFSYDGAGNIDLTLTAAPSPAPSPTPRPTLANLATRLRVETGDNALIGGFIVTGTQPKKVIIRAIGPSLGLPDQLANPTLELHDGTGALLASNDDWKQSANKQAIIDSTIPPTHDLESAIVADLPANGAGYTAVVRGVGDTAGIGLVEVYDLNSAANCSLANIATRGLVQTGDNVLFAGTIVTGPGSQKVVIRAIGPSLSLPGKLMDPTLELRDGNGALVQFNDNWRTGGQEAEIIATTIPPANDAEAAIVADLSGNQTAYTAIVRGANNSTGIAVVEVYALR
jgi:hypothetical protein